MNFLDYFFAALKYKSAESKLTQKQVAEKAGIQSTNISRAKKGHQTPGIEVLSKIADIFNMDLIDFVTLGRKIETGELAQGSLIEPASQTNQLNTEDVYSLNEGFELQRKHIKLLEAENARLKALLGGAAEPVGGGDVPPAQTQTALGASKN